MVRQKIIKYLQAHGGLAFYSTLIKAGMDTTALRTLKNQGKVENIARGLYRLTDYNLIPHPDLVIASLQAPKGVICLLSALYFHEATNEIPHCVTIAIPAGSRAGKIKYPPIKFYRFSMKTWATGIEDYEIDKNKIRVYSLAKTVADCFKFRNKIGIDVAREALKIAVTEKHENPKEIMHYAKICRVDAVMKPILEAML